MISALALYNSFTPARMAAGEARFAKSGTVPTDIAYFKAKAAKATSVDDFLKDYRCLKFITTAYDISSQLQYSYRLKTILKDDASSAKALVNKMNDVTYKQMNKDFDFFNSGTKNLQNSTFIDKLVTKFTDASYQQSLGDLNPALTDALYFEKKIGSIKSGYQILGDSTLWNVVKTAFSIPPAAIQGNLSTLGAKLEKLIDMSKVGDTAYVKKISQRYLAMADIASQKSAGNPLLDLLA